jgi:hypothetical protein
MNYFYFSSSAARQFLLVLFLAISAHQATAQSHDQISRKLNIYVYPAKGQSSAQQRKDESECYNWAKQRTGLDPSNMPKVLGAAPTETSSTGETLKGGAIGAAGGAAIGAIVGGAGEGALIGGLTGAVVGRRRGKKQEREEQEQIQASVTAQEQENWSRYIRAFAGCIEGKGYTIK